MFDEPGLAQTPGNLLGLFVFGFKSVDQIQRYQFGQLDVQRHGAAIGRAGIAHAPFVTGPTLDAIDIDDANG